MEIRSMFTSDWMRAVQTGALLARSLGLPPPPRTRLLREVLPSRVPGRVIRAAKRQEGAERVERILKRFFKPCRDERHEIMVAHGNLIRALVLRVSSGKVDGWHRLTTDNASVTTFCVSQRGVEVVSVNMVSHLPPQLRTNF
jgi:broad specificity phosphatase PhoE